MSHSSRHHTKDRITQRGPEPGVFRTLHLGALDKGEQFLNGSYKYLVWTEDTDTKPLEVLLVANGIPSDQTLIFSYQASSKVDAAKLMASFTERVRPGVRGGPHFSDRCLSSHDRH